MLDPRLKERDLHDQIVQEWLVSAQEPQPRAEEPQLEAEIPSLKLRIPSQKVMVMHMNQKLDHLPTIREVSLEGGQIGGIYGTSIGQPSIYYTPFNSSRVKTVLSDVYILKTMYY